MYMRDNLRMQISIVAKPWEEVCAISEGLHRQLEGNEDYENGYIELETIDNEFTVLVSIHKECKHIPKLRLF